MHCTPMRHHRLLRKKALIAALALAGFAGFVRAQTLEAPRPPCAGASPVPAHAEPGKPPAVATWTDPAWRPPACLGWSSTRSKLVVALAASFRHAGGAAALLERFGAISALRGLRYWSVTDNAWRELITDAAALESAPSRKRRPDFTARELVPGAAVFFEQTEGRSAGPAVYRLRILESASDRLVITTENVTPVRAFALTLFPAGALRATYLLQERAQGVWNFYGILSTTTEASPLAAVSPPSYVNRATALYRHFARVSP